MSFYWKCSNCGANLDPGERCSCYQEQEEKERALSALLRQGAGGQMEIGGLYAGIRGQDKYTCREV